MCRRVLSRSVHSSSPSHRAAGYSWCRGCSFFLHHEILQGVGAVLNDLHHHVEQENKLKSKA
jgi:hypothetical protein